MYWTPKTISLSLPKRTVLSLLSLSSSLSYICSEAEARQGSAVHCSRGPSINIPQPPPLQGLACCKRVSPITTSRLRPAVWFRTRPSAFKRPHAHGRAPSQMYAVQYLKICRCGIKQCWCNGEIHRDSIAPMQCRRQGKAKPTGNTPPLPGCLASPGCLSACDALTFVRAPLLQHAGARQA